MTNLVVPGAVTNFSRVPNSNGRSVPCSSRLLFRQAWTSRRRWETKGDLVYAFDVPGVPEEKIAVEIEEIPSTVSGSRERAEKVEDERFFVTSVAGDFTRRSLTAGLWRGRGQAHYANGALESTSRSGNSPSLPRAGDDVLSRRSTCCTNGDPAVLPLCAGERGFSSGGRDLQVANRRSLPEDVRR